MEVKFEKKGLRPSKLNIYIDNFLWKVVKASYFERKLAKLAKEEGFKEKFLKLERKKCLEIAVYLLSKRGYLKKEWEKKMHDRFFPKELVEDIYQTYLTPYFDENEEVRRRMESYLAAGKGERWIKQKMKPHISLTDAEFNAFLYTTCSEDAVIEKIQRVESSRNLLATKGRDKTIAFFMRRGFSYHHIQQALWALPQTPLKDQDP